MSFEIQNAREIAQDYLAANPRADYVIVSFSGWRFSLNSAGHETIKAKEPQYENRIQNRAG